MTSKLLPKRFPAYILTQSLGAFNDNFFKMLLQLYVLQVLVVKHAEQVMSEETFIFLATLIFTVPFVLFGTWSGYLADKYAKSEVMRVVKVMEIGIMLLGALALHWENVNMMFAVLFLMASQSTFFSPAKYGYIPEASRPQAVTAANGWVEMTTFLSIILGTAVTGFLLTYHDFSAVKVAYYCIGVAAAGSLSALFIAKVPAAGTAKRFPINPLAGIINDLVFLKKQKGLFLAALANSYFWLIGLIFQTNILIYGKNMLAGHPNGTILLSLLPAYIGVGIAVGSLLASRWSGKKVEIGLVPLGGLGMAFSGIALFFTTQAYALAAVVLFIAGMFGGLYIVPLYAYLQFFAKEDEKGRVMATTGILNGLFMVLGSLIYGLFAVNLAVPAHTIYLIMGSLTLLVLGYLCVARPEYLTRFIAWLLTHFLYRLRIHGIENVPFRGPALLIASHISPLDPLLIASCTQRFIHFLVAEELSPSPALRKLFNLMDVIPLDSRAGKKSAAGGLQHARRQLQNGHAVCILPEGIPARGSSPGKLRLDVAGVLTGLDCPVIPVLISNEREGRGGIVKGRKKGKSHSIGIVFGAPLAANAPAGAIEKAIRGLRETGQGREQGQ
ncbi:MAG: MFS transporter [Calditrichaceae bacterium]|nr:MFS transporter [Calditrichia bacterium]NUQ42752.1 MFS transporter [Calditrichaceae bacterium]